MNCFTCSAQNQEVPRRINSHPPTHYNYHQRPPNIKIMTPPRLFLEKRLLWAAFTMAFYRFLRASEFATPSLTWQHVQLVGNKYTIFTEQSKTDPFRCGHATTIHASGTSNCRVRHYSYMLRQSSNLRTIHQFSKVADFPH